MGIHFPKKSAAPLAIKPISVEITRSPICLPSVSDCWLLTTKYSIETTVAIKAKDATYSVTRFKCMSAVSLDRVQSTAPTC